jgi:DNA processing protein
MLTTAPNFANVVSPWLEMKSWETLWGLRNQTQKTICELFQRFGTKLPSETLERVRASELFPSTDIESAVEAFLQKLHTVFSVCLSGTFHYPRRLREAKYPLELFYYRGDAGLIESKSVSIVGARKCSQDGRMRAARLARELVKADYTVVSGLASGIDTAAMEATIEAGGRTIGVIGTPLNHAYPKENSRLQETIAREHLLISQVPFYRYAHEHWENHRVYFPQRNETMAALSSATIIVEASETSGTHTQARACMRHGRKLFILSSCFESGLKWPFAYESEGAIRVRDMNDIFTALRSDEHGGEPLEED